MVTTPVDSLQNSDTKTQLSSYSANSVKRSKIQTKLGNKNRDLTRIKPTAQLSDQTDSKEVATQQNEQEQLRLDNDSAKQQNSMKNSELNSANTTNYSAIPEFSDKLGERGKGGWCLCGEKKEK